MDMPLDKGKSKTAFHKNVVELIKTGGAGSWLH